MMENKAVLSKEDKVLMLQWLKDGVIDLNGSKWQEFKERLNSFKTLRPLNDGFPKRLPDEYLASILIFCNDIECYIAKPDGSPIEESRNIKKYNEFQKQLTDGK